MKIKTQCAIEELNSHGQQTVKLANLKKDNEIMELVRFCKELGLECPKVKNERFNESVKDLFVDLQDALSHLKGEPEQIHAYLMDNIFPAFNDIIHSGEDLTQDSVYMLQIILFNGKYMDVDHFNKCIKNRVK